MHGQAEPPAHLRALATAAAAWSLAFAAIHVAWALGSGVGLGGRRVTGALLVIDVVAIPLCLLAAWVAWRLAGARRAACAPRFVLRMAAAAAIVLTLRGLGTIQAVVAPADDATLLTRLVDPYFLLGGILFALVSGQARRARSLDRSRPQGELAGRGFRIRVGPARAARRRGRTRSAGRRSGRRPPSARPARPPGPRR